MTARLALAVTLGLAGATMASAQERLSLEEAITLAVQHSARLVEIEARREGASAAERARIAERRPLIGVQAGYTRTNHVDEYAIALPGQPSRVLYPDVPNNVRSRLDLQWPIYTAGRLDALARAARAEGAATGEELEAARADLVLEVTRVFSAILTAMETEAVLGRSRDRMDVHLRDLRARLDQGLISPHEVLSAEAQRARQELAVIEARSTRMRMEADLHRLTGSTKPVVASGPSLPLLESRETAANSNARNERPELRALKQRLEAARARLSAAGAGRRPQVLAVAGYDYARPNPRIFPRADRWEPSWDVSLNLAWTLWDGGRTAAARAEAAAAVKAIEARGTELDRQIDLEVRSRSLELEAARAALPAADAGVTAAQEAHRVLGERYKAGVATSAELLDAEIGVLQAELDRLRARAGILVAETALLRAAGRLR